MTAIYTQDLTESTVFTALGTVITQITGLPNTQVLRAPTNRVPMPNVWPFFIMSPLLKEELGRPLVTINTVGSPAIYTESILAPVNYHIQLDAYGPTGGDVAQIVFSVLNSADAFALFAALATPGVYPLYASGLHEHALVNAEADYEVRWTMDVCLQYNPTLTSTVQTTSTVTVGIINVDAAYQ
jgi:hypothetical protein